MKKRLVSMAMLVFLLAFGLVFASCGDDSSKLTGIWELESVENGSASDMIQRMELFKDGTSNMDGMDVTWKVENNRMMITAFGQAQSESYKLSGKKLTFTSDEGIISVYKKVN